MAESWDQRVRDQSRPDQELGVVRVRDLPLSRPVGVSTVLSAPVRIPGHTVYRHLLKILNDVDPTSVDKKIIIRV